MTNAIPTNMANTTSTSVTRTVPINSDDENVWYKKNCHINGYVTIHNYYLLSLYKK